MRRRFAQAEEAPPKEKILDVDASMQGTLSFNDPVNLRINGKFEGKLNTKGTLMVGEHANVNADIIGDYITIAGNVRGSIKAAKEISVISPAKFSGNLETPVLSVAQGAVINGNIRMTALSHTKSLESANATLTLDEVADYLEIDKNVVSEWAENGRLPGRKEGNNWIVDKAVLENWVSNEQIG